MLPCLGLIFKFWIIFLQKEMYGLKIGGTFESCHLWSIIPKSSHSPTPTPQDPFLHWWLSRCPLASQPCPWRVELKWKSLSTSRPEKLLEISNVLYSIIFAQEEILFLSRTPVRVCASYLHSHVEGFSGGRMWGQKGSSRPLWIKFQSCCELFKFWEGSGGVYLTTVVSMVPGTQ